MKSIILVSMALGMTPTLLPAQSPIITNQPASRAVWAGGNVIFSAGVSGAGPFSYQWQFDGASLTNGIITTIAGAGTNFPGDGGPAMNALLDRPTSVGLDNAGDLLVVQYYSQLVRKIDGYGMLSTVAGTGVAGFSGDGGPAINAQLHGPKAVGADNSGNVYIADHDNYYVRKVDSHGIITTVAGTGVPGCSGDGGPATNASLTEPTGVTVDSSGNIYIVDASCHTVRKVDTNGVITSVAGSAPGFGGDGGPATNAALQSPMGVTADSLGNLFIADMGNQRIRKVSSQGIITTVAGNGVAGYSGDGGAATNASLNYPFVVAVDMSGNLFITDTHNYCVRKVDNNGVITTVAGNGMAGFSGDGGPATNATLITSGATVDGLGNLFIAQSTPGRIRKVGNTQGPSLLLNSVGTSDAGSYQVVVSGASGSVTSAVATLTVATSPLVYRTIRNPDGSVTLVLVSRPGSSNLVLTATSLTSPVQWQPVWTNIAGPDGNWQFTDTSAANSPTRFYRSAMQ